MNRRDETTALKLLKLVPELDVNSVDKYGRTVLALACELDMPRVAQECAKRAALVSVEDAG